MHRLRRTRRSLHQSPERGSTAIQSAIAAVVLLMVIMVIIQAGLWAHARNVAISAAQVGVQKARGYDATAGDGQSAATGYVSNGAGGFFDGTTVTVSRSGETVTATVTGTYPSVFPGITFPQVTARAEAPVERLTR